VYNNFENQMYVRSTRALRIGFNNTLRSVRY